jgi:hypothetical protein
VPVGCAWIADGDWGADEGSKLVFTGNGKLNREDIRGVGEERFDEVCGRFDWECEHTNEEAK